MGEKQESSPKQTESEGATALSEDRLYRALASTRRRRLLYYLLYNEETYVEALATVLAGWEATESGTLSTPADRRQIIVELEHVHLPLLSEAGLLSHDRSAGTVQLRQLNERVRNLIEQYSESASERQP
jgi:hypothetical protein